MEAAIVLTDSGKEFLRKMCYYVPEFDDATNMDTEFWRDFMFYSFTGLLDESIEQIEVYREDIGYETQAKVSMEQMEKSVKLTFGDELPDLKPKYEEMQEGQTAFYFEDGYYYIGCSDFPDFDFTYKAQVLLDDFAVYLLGLPEVCVVTQMELDDPKWKPPFEAGLIVHHMNMGMKILPIFI